MLLLIICILFNTYIGIIFKYFKKYEVRTLHAIIINYIVCILTASIVLGRPAITMATFSEDWIWAAVLLGFTFVITFNLFAYTVQKLGVVIGSIFQKMSLIAPAIIAIMLYGESSNLTKIIGITLAILSIFLISLDKNTDNKSKASVSLWILPIGTFIGSCIIDSGLFYINKVNLVDSMSIDFIATLFFFAGILGSLFILYEYIKTKKTFRKKEIFAGIMLGVPNFFSIYFLLKVLSNGMDASVVFPINNVGILSLTALIGWTLFKESFTIRKLIGFVFALISIALLSLG
ncbi:MAG: DMT family transporter [Saprospiraceae bacterium]